jgi:hypothetical protein
MKRTTSISPLSAVAGALKPLLEIQKGGSSAGLVERALLLQTLDRQLRQYLPDDVAGQCSLANVHPDKLVFLTTSSTWKARLRLHEPELVAAAKQVGLQVNRMIVKVATMQSVSPETASREPLSNTAREHLRAAAQSIDDPELRAQLLALASLP